MMECEGTMLVVKDMAVSRQFYRDALECELVMEVDEYVVFKGFSLLSEELWFSFHQGERPILLYGGNVSQLCFEVIDLDAVLLKLQNRSDIVFEHGVKQFEWGQRSFRIYDPDRHLIEIGEDMREVTKRYLRSGMSVDETIAKVLYPRDFVERCARDAGIMR
ncbi:MAG: hypothetical protein LIP23_01435 [Planctomycetes bacterium]|nr:hypothetical protein [Planctomycetota bacterium]